jgi:hypothetical protein
VGSRNDIYQKSTPHSHQEATSRKDQGQTLLGEGSAPPMTNEDDPAAMGIAAPMASKGEGTYKTSNK